MKSQVSPALTTKFFGFWYNFTLFDFIGISYHYPATRPLKFSEVRTTN